MVVRHGWGLVATTLAVVVLAGACSEPAPVATEPSAGPGRAATPSAGAVTPSPTSTAAAPSTARPAPAPTSLTLAFAGDLHFEGRVSALVRPGGLDALRPVLAGADVSVVNLETAITDRGTPQPKTYHFRTTPQALVTLQQAGVDVVSMANNHAVDFGADGLADTLAARAASPIPVVGIGADETAALAPAVFTVHGVSVAVLASTQVDDFTAATFPATATRAGVAQNVRSNAALLAAVRAARARYDVVVVYLHWGTDYTTCPDPAQERTERDLEQAGVDVVVGGHAHRVQGYGWRGRTFVQYGLGNFVWLSTRAAIDTWSGVQTVTVDLARAVAQRDGPADRSGRTSVVTAARWSPLVVGDDGIPRPPSSAQAPAMARQVAAAVACSGLSDHPPG